MGATPPNATALFSFVRLFGCSYFSFYNLSSVFSSSDHGHIVVRPKILPNFSLDFSILKI